MNQTNGLVLVPNAPDQNLNYWAGAASSDLPLGAVVTRAAPRLPAERCARHWGGGSFTFKSARAAGKRGTARATGGGSVCARFKGFVQFARSVLGSVG